MNARLLFVHALSTLHAGTGQGVGVIDLPIAREKATGIPYLPGSSLKGVLRDSCTDADLRKRIFGPDTNNASEHAGAVQIADQRLVLLPVRSLAGTFAWVTSPYVLKRLKRDAETAGASDVPKQVPGVSSDTQAVIGPAGTALKASGDKVILEDLDLKTTIDESVGGWAEWLAQRVFPSDSEWGAMPAAKMCVVHDDVFAFLLDTATEVTARIRLDAETKTVAKGALWYEEGLPAESILAGLVVATPGNGKTNPEEIFSTLESLTESPAQLGGKATVGRGLCRLTLKGGGR